MNSHRLRHTSAVAVLILGLAACSVAGSPPSFATTSLATVTPITVVVTATGTPERIDMRWFSFFGGSTHGVWDVHVRKAFEEAHPGIKVTYGASGLYSAPVPADALDRQLNLERPPDVITGFIGGASLERYITAGKIAPLTDVWDEEDLGSAYPESVADLAKVDGTPYFVPLAAQWNPVFYRKDIFNQLGLQPPDSWDSLLQACHKLSDAGYTPITDSAASWTPPNARWFSILDLRLNGPAFHQQLMAGEISFDDQRVRNVFDHWLEMLDAGCFAPADQPGSWFQAVNQISDGRAAMFNIGEWLYEFITPDIKQNLDFFRFPTLNPTIDNGEIALVYGAYIPSGALHPDAGRDFIRYLLSEQGLQSNIDEVGRLIPIDRLPQDTFPAYQQKGFSFLRDSTHLVELFEFNAFEGTFAAQGLSDLAAFWKARDEAGIDAALAGLETARQEALAQASE